MHGRREEILIVSVAALLLLGVFGAIAIFDRPHTDVGEEYGLEQVNISIEEASGNIVTPDLPEGLFIFGAGSTASMEFRVTNSDPDNDIDTIAVTIPGAAITGATYTWDEMGEDHQWTLNITSGTATFTAVTDYAGANYGGDPQYDTAGGEDDALDHDADDSTNEGIVLKVNFTASSTPGLKDQTDALSVKVGDMITEKTTPALASFSPFPYPYWVASNGVNYIVMVLEETNVDLEVVYDGQTYFGASRASDFMTFEHGMKYYTAEGKAVAVIEKPEAGTVVKPAVRPKTAGLSGQFTIDVFTVEIADIVTAPTKTAIVTDYKENIPAQTSSVADLDMDSDGIYNNADDDADGDGQAKTIDRDDRDRNSMEYAPTGLKANVDKISVENGETFVLTASATDANSDAITYTWTVDKVPGWSQTGPSVTVVAKGDFKPGETYVFTVRADDGHHTTKPTEKVSVDIKEEENSNVIVIVAIVAIVVVVAIVAFFFIFRKKEGEGEIEERIDAPARREAPMEEAPSVPQDAAKAAAQTQEYEVEEFEETSTGEVAASHDSEEIENLEALAEDLDKSDACPECGSTLSQNDLKCANCGAEFDLELECPGCKSALNQSDKKCPGCGMEFA